LIRVKATRGACVQAAPQASHAHISKNNNEAIMRLFPAVLAVSALALSQSAVAYDWNDWPTKHKTANGYEFGIKGVYQADSEDFSHDRLPGGGDRFDDLTTWRRKEFNAYLKKDGVFELTFGYDFAAIKKNWIDNYLRLYTKNHGSFRIGQFKTPVGWEDSGVGAGGTVFLERGLPEQAIYEDRRLGVDWQYDKFPGWLFNLAYFGHHDLLGDNAGHTIGGHVVYNPIKNDDEVVHLGFAASREDRDDETARIRAKPEANVTPVRLIDTLALHGSDHIDRMGLEAGWRKGSWLLQGEYLNVNVSRQAGLPDFSGGGFYVFGSYLITGEKHPYKNGAFGNPVPSRNGGALEVALRYSQLDLNDGPIHGGRQHDWTLGLNYYLTSHFKLQANYVRAFSDRGTVSLDPHVFELRAQLSF
jgi:phosphate-selective porin OprO/OprP